MRYAKFVAVLAGAAFCGGVAVAQPSDKGADKPKASQPAEKGKSDAKGEAKEFSIEGYYVEACSCRPPCPCEQMGAEMSCKGVLAYQFDKGKYGGEDFSGTRVAAALYIGQSVHLYIDAPDAPKRAAAEKFARAAFAAFGPVKGVHEAKIEISGKDGTYTATIDGGKVMKCTTEPTMGGDEKTAIVHENVKDKLNPTMYQGTVVSCSYNEGDMKINLDKGRNVYFNQHMKSNGKI